MTTPDPVRRLEAVQTVASKYDLPRETLMTCVASVLSGDLGGSGRHDAAFVIAAALRGMGFRAPGR
jgi:hypothetical protein